MGHPFNSGGKDENNKNDRCGICFDRWRCPFPRQLFAQKMRVGYWTSGFSLGFGAVMEQMKFAENQGLNVEWVKFAEVNGPTRAIVSNAIDIAFAAPSTNSIGIAADGVPVKIVLATQIAEAQIVVLDGSPIKAVGDLKGKKIGMSPPGSATHAIATAILDQNFGLKPNEYSIAPGNEAQLAQFLSQKEIDAGVLRSVTLAQIEEVKLRRLGKHRRRVEKTHQGKCATDPRRDHRLQRLSRQESGAGGEIYRRHAQRAPIRLEK